MLNNNQLIAVQLVAQGKTGKFTLEKMPVYHIVGDDKKKKAS